MVAHAEGCGPTVGHACTAARASRLMPLVGDLLDRAARATPPATEDRRSGWWLRHTDNSTWWSGSVLAHGADDALVERIEATERFYAESDAIARFQVCPDCPANLDEALAARGYRWESPILLMTAEAIRCGQDGPPGVAVHLAGSPTRQWHEVLRVTTGAEANVEHETRRLEELALPKTFVTVLVGGEPVGIGRAVAETLDGSIQHGHGALGEAARCCPPHPVRNRPLGASSLRRGPLPAGGAVERARAPTLRESRIHAACDLPLPRPRYAHRPLSATAPGVAGNRTARRRPRSLAVPERRFSGRSNRATRSGRRVGIVPGGPAVGRAHDDGGAVLAEVPAGASGADLARRRRGRGRRTDGTLCGQVGSAVANRVETRKKVNRLVMHGSPNGPGEHAIVIACRRLPRALQEVSARPVSEQRVDGVAPPGSRAELDPSVTRTGGRGSDPSWGVLFAIVERPYVPGGW